MSGRNDARLNTHYLVRFFAVRQRQQSRWSPLNRLAHVATTTPNIAGFLNAEY
jgi:hypothetical protein